MEAETESAVIHPEPAPIRFGTVSAPAGKPSGPLTTAGRLEVTARERPLRVGVLSGLGYRNLKGDLDRTTRFLRTEPGIAHRVVESREDVAETLGEYLDDGIDVVAVSGGDGTVSMVATHLLGADLDGPPPPLAVFQGGRTNMTAGDVGIRGNQTRNLRHLRRWAEAPVLSPALLTERPVIGVASPGHAPRCGFFVGGGAVYHGSLHTWTARDSSRLPFMRGGLGTAKSVVKMLTNHLVSRSAFPPSRMGISVDGTRNGEETWCVLFATTLRRMALGIRPFWGREEGPIRVTAVAQEHRKLLRAAAAGLRGRPGRSLNVGNGYHSFNGRRIEIELDTGVTLDGEIIEPENGKLVMSSPGSLTFLRL